MLRAVGGSAVGIRLCHLLEVELAVEHTLMLIHLIVELEDHDRALRQLLRRHQQCVLGVGYAPAVSILVEFVEHRFLQEVTILA